MMRGRVLVLSSIIVALQLVPVIHAAESVPELALEQLDGSPFSLRALSGSVVVLDFWASWCVPCRQSFPFLDSLQREHRDDGLRVVALSLDEDPADAAAFRSAQPATFTVVRDPALLAGERFQIAALPTTLLIDRQGQVVARFEGADAAVHEQLRVAVERLLAGQPLPNSSGRLVPTALRASGTLKAWQRGHLADPMMNLDGDPLTRLLREHIHASKEAAAGDGGAAGGGCGCN